MPKKTELTRKEEENLTRLIYHCTVCNRIFKEPGICDKCDVILKAKAS